MNKIFYYYKWKELCWDGVKWQRCINVISVRFFSKLAIDIYIL